MAHRKYADIAINAIGKVRSEFDESGKYKPLVADLERMQEYLEKVKRMPEP